MVFGKVTRKALSIAVAALAAALVLSGCSGAGASLSESPFPRLGGGGDYLVVYADRSRALLVKDAGDARAWSLDVSGLADIGAEPGDRVRLGSPRAEGEELLVDYDPWPLSARWWSMEEKCAVGADDIGCAEKYAWLPLMGGQPEPWEPDAPAGGEDVAAGDALVAGVPIAADVPARVLTRADEVAGLTSGAYRTVGAGGEELPADGASLADAEARVAGWAESGGRVACASVVLPYSSQRPEVAGVRFAGGRYVVDVRVLRGDGEESDGACGAWVLLAPAEPRELREGVVQVSVRYLPEAGPGGPADDGGIPAGDPGGAGMAIG